MKEKWRKGYKVVRRVGSGYRSSYMGLREPSGYKLYVMGSVTQRSHNWGPLAVFSNKRKAIRFAKKNTCYGCNMVVLRCEYTKSSDEEYWSMEFGNNIRRVCSASIDGKRFADAVKPTSRLLI